MAADEFFKRYCLLASSLRSLTVIPPKRKCRFCGLYEPEVTFLKKAHLISELLGKNNSTGYDECDTCNQLFSKYESHLSKFFQPNLTMMGIIGKSGVPSFQSRTEDRNENTRTTIKYNPNTHSRQIIQSKQEDFVIDHENNTGVLKFRKPRHIPMYVYKVLVKYGLSIMPNSRISDYKNALAWLKENKRVAVFPSVMCRTLTNKKFAHPFVELYEANSELTEENLFIPKHIAIVCFANIILQVTLPVTDKIADKELVNKTAQIPIFPKLNSNEIAGNKEGYHVLDFSSQDKVTGNYKMYVKFDSYHKSASDEDI